MTEQFLFSPAEDNFFFLSPLLLFQSTSSFFSFSSPAEGCSPTFFILKINFFSVVPDPPQILRVTPARGDTVGVHNRTIFTCSAEGNPLPKYQWLQQLPSRQVNPKKLTHYAQAQPVLFF
jgi:hypothetical protein